MENVLFLQSEVAEPYAVYEQMLASTPVYRDPERAIWAVYSYSACKTVLDNNSIEIPWPATPGEHLLNEAARTIKSNLARLGNSPQHAFARDTAKHMYGQLKPVAVPKLLQGLLTDCRKDVEWVSTIGRKLPVLYLLEGFNFGKADQALILEYIVPLTQLMLPGRTAAQIAEINTAAQSIYTTVAAHIIREGYLREEVKDEALLVSGTSNLAGLFIQAYDAGRGVLSNSLLQVLRNRAAFPQAPLPTMIIEALRIDAPVQNTRRVLTADLILEGQQLKKGETVLVVLAAANRDPRQFLSPGVFDPYRSNNASYLSFGSGAHVCLAEHFSVHLAAAALGYLFSAYKNVMLADDIITYEPMINARLPKAIHLSVIRQGRFRQRLLQ